MTPTRTLKMAIGAFTAVAGLAAIPVSAATARPAGDVADPAIAVGTVRPPTNGPLKPVTPPIPRSLSSFSVTTDSVVATATITYTGSVSNVLVRWGDGTVSSRNPGAPCVTIGCPTDPPGTVVFKHEYAAGANGAAFSLFATGQVTSATGTESDVRSVTITPRFRVNAYQAFFANEYECGDPFYESETEWRVDRTLTTFGANGQSTSASTSWSFDRAADDNIVPEFDFLVLPGSQLQLDLTMADQHPFASYKATELDEWFDDEFSAATIDLHPSLGTRSVQVNMSDGDCTAAIKTDVNVALLRPGLNQGGAGGVGGGVATTG